MAITAASIANAPFTATILDGNICYCIIYNIIILNPNNFIRNLSEKRKNRNTR